MEALGLPKMILSPEIVFQQFNLAPEARTGEGHTPTLETDLGMTKPWFRQF